MDRLLRRGHGPAVYGYGWGWFSACLHAADAADADAAEREQARERIRRMQAMGDMCMALHGTKDAVERHLNSIARG